MATGALFHDPLWVPLDSSGNAYPGALMYVYQAGSTSAVATYVSYDTTGSTHTSPIVADSAGKFPAVYVAKTDAYRLRRVLKTSAGVTIRDDDNLPFPTSGGTLASTYVQTSDTGKTFTGDWIFSGGLSGAGFTNLFASPPAIGTTAPAGGRFTQAYTAPVAITFHATAMTWDLSLSNTFTLTMTANVTTAPSIINAASGQSVIIKIKQDGTGSRTMTWPAKFKWGAGSAGVLTTTASGRDTLTLTYWGDEDFYEASLNKGVA